ncbi:MAG: ABC transporter ATP-binding protein [Deltaproteobacteria bacterium]|nr:ABC transporter ATP-binding protein [Deltaproteobacteria bacterium]
MGTLLEIQDLTVRFGGLAAVSQLTFGIEEGSILGLIGPNGSGKSTCLNVISRIYAPDTGRLTFMGRDITGLKSYQVVPIGIARTFQNLRIFKNISCLDNVLIGRHHLIRTNALNIFFRPFKAGREERIARDKAKSLLDMVGLANRADELAGSLPYGAQRRLEIARAMAIEPKLLLLDEPNAGMNPRESLVLIELIQTIRQKGLTILIIEHNMKTIMSVSDRIVVLNSGRKLFEGTPTEVQQSKAVQEVYLGRDEEGD